MGFVLKQGTLGGSISLPISTYTGTITLSSHSSVTVMGKTYHYWSTASNPSGGLASAPVYCADYNLPTQIFWWSSRDAGIQFNFGMKNTGYTFGKMLAFGHNVGSDKSWSGSADSTRIMAVTTVSTAYGTALVSLYGRVSSGHEPTDTQMYPLGYAVCFDGIDALLDDHHKPDDDYGGGGGNPDGGDGTGTGIKPGDSIATYDIADEVNKQSMLGCGLYAYVLDRTQLLSLMKYLWGESSDYIDSFWRRWENYRLNPISGILSCHRLPGELMPATASAVAIRCAGVVMSGTGGTPLDAAMGAPFLNNYNRVWTSEYGIDIPPPNGDFTDFTCVSAVLYLPFVGEMSIDPAKFMGRPTGGGAYTGGHISVQYCCDALTGDCAAIVRGTNMFGENTVIGQATGNAAMRQPVSGNDQGFAGVLSGASSVVGGIVSGVSGNIAGAVGGVASGIVNAMSAPHSTQIIGQPGGSAGWCSQWCCYLSVYYGMQVESENYDKMYGRPSMVSAPVSGYIGYCELEVHADGIGQATEAEKREIETLLRGGVIV